MMCILGKDVVSTPNLFQYIVFLLVSLVSYCSSFGYADKKTLLCSCAYVEHNVWQHSLV